MLEIVEMIPIAQLEESRRGLILEPPSMSSLALVARGGFNQEEVKIDLSLTNLILVDWHI